MNEYIVGIDIGSSKICGAIGKVDNFGCLHILGVAATKCYGVKKSIVIDIEATAEAINKCKIQLETIAGIEIDEAYLSIPGGLCELVFTKGVIAVSSDNREIGKNDVERVINAAKIISIPSNKEIISVIPDKFVVDGSDNIAEPVGMNGIRLEVDARAAVIQSSYITNLLKSMRMAGIKAADVIIQPLALGSLSLSKGEKSGCFAFVSAGADIIDIGIYRNGSICHTAMIPLGGNTITNDISKCMKVSMAEAEELKTTEGSVILPEEDSDNNLLIEIIRARVQELLIFIKNELNSTDYFNEVSEILITGGGLTHFKGITELCREELGKSVRIVYPQGSGISAPEYSTAVGIIKRVYETLKVDSIVHELDSHSQVKLSQRNNNKSNKFISKIRDIIDELF